MKNIILQTILLLFKCIKRLSILIEYFYRKKIFEISISFHGSIAYRFKQHTRKLFKVTE